MDQNEGVTPSGSGHQPSASAPICVGSSQSGVPNAEHFVKIRTAGSGKFRFLTPKGGLTPLRIHAAIFRDRETAQKTIDLNAPNNPGTEWKAVRA